MQLTLYTWISSFHIIANEPIACMIASRLAIAESWWPKVWSGIRRDRRSGKRQGGNRLTCSTSKKNMPLHRT